MTVYVAPPSPSHLTRASRLIERARRLKAPIYVRPYVVAGKWRCFAYLLTDTGRERVDLIAFGILIRERAVRVHHVFANSDLLYEAGN